MKGDADGNEPLDAGLAPVWLVGCLGGGLFICVRLRASPRAVHQIKVRKYASSFFLVSPDHSLGRHQSPHAVPYDDGVCQPFRR